MSYLLNLVALSLQICLSYSKQKPLLRVDPISCLCFSGQHFSKYVSTSWGLNLGSTAVPPLEGVAYCWQLWLGLQSCGHNSHDNHPTTSMYLSRTLQFPLYRRETGSERPMTAPGYSISNKVELNSRSHPRGLHSREKKLSLKAC